MYWAKEIFFIFFLSEALYGLADLLVIYRSLILTISKMFYNSAFGQVEEGMKFVDMGEGMKIT